ncbi:MAG: DUF1552 domain-containing protein [Verrucomicrobia bacterium]|nr:DUF1552 domain-containing protein [Verrucomicrobiota bacterium]
MSTNWQIPRRTFLKGLGTAIALPMLDAMVPVRAVASMTDKTKPPTRMAFVYVPNGAHMQDWTPSKVGADFDLPPTLRPLAPVKNDLLVLTGLTHDKGRTNSDGAGHHARGATVFLTGSQALKSEGAEIRAGVSVDQYAAALVGKNTRFQSLELGTEAGRQAGKCDSGYSCAYSNNISWRDESTPTAKETNPRLVFERLFGNGSSKERNEGQAKRDRYKKSILDFVLEDAKRLSNRVTGNDRQKLDEYLTAVREIENRIERAEKDTAASTIVLPGYERPAGIPASFEEHIRLMGDMMVLAFQSDVTRIATFMIANEGSNKAYPFIGVNNGHHELSHHQGDRNKQAKIAQINKFHIAQFSYILQRLKSIPEGDGTLLDNCMVVYGSALSDGNAHNSENLPVLLAGRGGGTIRTGRHVKYEFETPMCNLLLSMLDRVGASADYFGDSTGRLVGLEA